MKHLIGPPLLALALVGALSGAAVAQDGGGSTQAAVAGALLGGYSGTMLGLTGALIPCSQTWSGPTCSAVVAAVGGVAGASAGAVLGNGGSDHLAGRGRAALWGAGIGGVVGYAMKAGIRPYGWVDVASGVALGAAIGASGRGAAIGLGAGAFAGGILFAAVPSVRLGDAVAVGLAGMAIGGVMGWVADAANANSSGGQPLVLSFQVIL